MSDVRTKVNDPTSALSALTSNNLFQPLRIWPPVLLIVVAIVMKLIPRVYAEAPMGLQIASVLIPIVCGILTLLWWLLLSRATVKERLFGLLGVGGALGATCFLLDHSMVMPGLLIVTIPMGMAAFALGTILLARVLSFKRTIVAVLLAVCGFGFSVLLRNEGMWGEFAALELHWRWNLSHEEQMLAQREKEPSLEKAEISGAEVDAWLAEPEWPGFRGADRAGRQSGPALSTDWVTSPPEQLWKIPVGPGWSSFAVAGNLLFTQEQRGPQEVTVCYSAATGQEIWTQSVETRFFESMGGVGPRATPTLAEGSLYVMGANGHLMRLDPKSGKIAWQADLQTVADRTPPTWGFSSSPLVVGPNVIVHAGGKGDKGTLSFDKETGDLRWSAPAGDHSYSSPQLSTVAGKEVILVLTNAGLDVLDPETGVLRLTYAWPYDQYRVLQPAIVDDNSVLLCTGMGVGTRRVQITNRDGELDAEALWTSRDLKPDFNDLVVFQEYAFGFDGAILTCLDLATGDRTWKGGRYGKGQVLLLADVGLLLVISEQGEVVLLKADPTERQELAKFQALEGKTWNHPVVVGDRLYIRNAQEAACYRLPVANNTKVAWRHD